MIQLYHELHNDVNLKGNLTAYSASELESMISYDIQEILEENDINLKYVCVYVHGSRIFGTPSPESDLDFVLFYTGNYREDSLFNIFADEELYIEDIKCDINPINIDKDSIEQDIEEYIFKHDIMYKKINESLENTNIIGNDIQYLYHATPSCNIQSIKTFGLGNKLPKKRLWDYMGTSYDNIDHGVFLSTDEYIAYDYVESSDEYWELMKHFGNMNITVFRININDLNLEKLEIDKNQIISDNETPYSYFYNDVIPYIKLQKLPNHLFEGECVACGSGDCTCGSISSAYNTGFNTIGMGDVVPATFGHLGSGDLTLGRKTSKKKRNRRKTSAQDFFPIYTKK